MAAKILKALEAPVCAEGHELTLSASVGLALWPDMATDAVSLMSCADVAMHSAKRAGRNGWPWFKPGDNAVLPRKLRLENDLRLAAERGELALHFQPQFECAGGALVGAEALLRWHHPELGPVSPAEFIPMAEETGLIVPIGHWVLREAQQAVRDFCMHAALALPMPVVQVDGVGSLAFPLLESQAAALIAAAERAPYGRGEQTVLDTSVRRVWQIDAARVHLGGKHWAQSLKRVLVDAARGLGCGDAASGSSGCRARS